MLMAIRNACMGYALVVQHEKIIVMGHDHAALIEGKGDMGGIVYTEQPGVRSRRDINLAMPQPIGDTGVHMLIQVEFDHPYHDVRGVFGRGSTGSAASFLPRTVLAL